MPKVPQPGDTAHPRMVDDAQLEDDAKNDKSSDESPSKKRK